MQNYLSRFQSLTYVINFCIRLIFGRTFFSWDFIVVKEADRVFLRILFSRILMLLLSLLLLLLLLLLLSSSSSSSSSSLLLIYLTLTVIKYTVSVHR